MTEPYETLAKICSFFFSPPSNRVPCFLRGFGAFLPHSPPPHTSVCNGGLKSKVNICVCEASTVGFGKHFTSRRNRATGVGSPCVSASNSWRPDDDRCVGVWAESPSIFTNVLWRSVAHERIPAWLRVERHCSGSEGGVPPVAGGLSPPFLAQAKHL